MRVSPLRPPFLFLALAAAAAATPAAASVSHSATVTVCRFPFDASHNPYCVAETDPDLAAVQDNFGLPGVTYSFLGRGTASASYGTITFDGSYSMLQATEDLLCYHDESGVIRGCAQPVKSSSEFHDELVVGGTSGAGTLVVTFDVTTSMNDGCDAIEPCIGGLPYLGAYLFASFAGGSPLPPGSLGSYAGQIYDNQPDSIYPPASGPLETGPIPFTFGDSVPLDVRLGLILIGPTVPDLLGRSDLWNSQGALGIEVSPAAIEVFDGQGRPMPAAIVTAASGTTYPVPEPVAPAMALVALYALATLHGSKARARDRRRDSGPARGLD
jgi:hypothetical protein